MGKPKDKAVGRKPRNRPRDVLEPDEISRLMDACGEGDAAKRNRAIISLFTATGMRMSEILGLAVSDLDLEKKRATIVYEDRDDRVIWVHQDARIPMNEWMDARLRIMMRTTGPLFCNLKGQPLSSVYIRGMLPKLAKKAGISKRVHADGMRHTFAAMSYRAGVTTRSLQVQFDHKNIAATVAYLERIGLHAGFDEFEKAMG